MSRKKIRLNQIDVDVNQFALVVQYVTETGRPSKALALTSAFLKTLSSQYAYLGKSVDHQGQSKHIRDT